jgi:hypothetical protein
MAGTEVDAVTSLLSMPSRLIALGFLLWGPIAVTVMVVWAVIWTLVDALPRARRDQVRPEGALVGSNRLGRRWPRRTPSIADEAQDWLSRR